MTLSIYALNLAIGLSLGLAIDYSLLIVSRYREEMAARGPGPSRPRRDPAHRRQERAVQRGHRGRGARGPDGLPAALPVLDGRRGRHGGPDRRRDRAARAAGGAGAARHAASTRWPRSRGAAAASTPTRSSPRASGTASRTPSCAGRPRSRPRHLDRPDHRRAARASASTSPRWTRASCPPAPAPRQVSDTLEHRLPRGPQPAELPGHRRPGDAGGAGASSPPTPPTLGALPGAAPSPRRSSVGPDTWRIDVYAEAAASRTRARRWWRTSAPPRRPTRREVGGLAASFVDQKASLAAHLPWAILVIALPRSSRCSS